MVGKVILLFILSLQVVTLALYTYFVAALMGRQLVPPAPGSTSKYEPDVYFPLFTALQVSCILLYILLLALGYKHKTNVDMCICVNVDVDVALNSVCCSQ